jgi:hypothetical protein
MTRYLLLFDSCGLVFVGRPLWREDGSVICTCCWPLPAQSFSGPSSRPYFTLSNMRLSFSSPPTTRRVTVEVFDPASTRVYWLNQSQSHIATDSQSVSKSWCRTPSGTHDQIFSYYYLTVTVLFLWGALSDERTSLSFVYAAGSSQRSLSRVRVPWYSLLSQIWNFPFRGLLRLAGSRWRYSTPPPHGPSEIMAHSSRYIAAARTA